MKKILLILPVFFLLSSCISSKKIEEINTRTEKIAANNFKSDYKILYNKNYKFAAIYKRLEEDHNGKIPVKIMVIDLKNNKIIWGRKAFNGKLEWISKYKLQIDYKTKDNKRSSMIYDVKKKQVLYK